MFKFYTIGNTNSEKHCMGKEWNFNLSLNQETLFDFLKHIKVQLNSLLLTLELLSSLKYYIYICIRKLRYNFSAFLLFWKAPIHDYVSKIIPMTCPWLPLICHQRWQISVIQIKSSKFTFREAAKNISRGGSLNLAAFGRKVLTPPTFTEKVTYPP